MAEITQVMPSMEEEDEVNHDTNVMIGLIQGVDWNLVVRQKACLAALLCSNSSITEADKQVLTGVVALLDALQDAAKDDGLFIPPAHEPDTKVENSAADEIEF